MTQYANDIGIYLLLESGEVIMHYFFDVNYQVEVPVGRFTESPDPAKLVGFMWDETMTVPEAHEDGVAGIFLQIVEEMLEHGCG